ncbi:MAG: HD-GYP domain-containing protein [Lachnospiraceae bacterium]|nr:HD-GYP domain-containing protein [Lachnospiraceae bacterium]
MKKDTIDYERWKRIITITQFAIAGMIFVTEVIGNILLYVTRSQGYGPDTIVIKLLRYLVLTTVINFTSIFVGQYIIRKSKDYELHKNVLIIVCIIICTNVAFSHYQFASTLCIFTMPTIVSILYEDRKLTTRALLLGLVGFTIAVVARALDSGYNTDIGPEASIAFAFNVGIFVICRIILDTLAERRERLNEALVDAEKSKYLDRVDAMSFQMLRTLAQAIDAKDRYTNGHSFRVAEYSVMLAKAMGYSKTEQDMLRREALLHDIGKIGVPDSILNKPGKLDELEFSVMKSHTTVGSEILDNMIMIPGAAAVAAHHHERYDGHGYPDGLVGEEIPEHARIVGIADAYDAMSSDRIYRKKLTKGQIREQFERGRGTQFDPNLLNIFLELFERDELLIKASPELEDNVEYASVESVAVDLQRFIDELITGEGYNGAMSVDHQDFSLLYEYVKKMGERYGHTFEIVTITAAPKPDFPISDDDLERASGVMELAVRKNIRAVDIYTRYSRTQHVAILINAGTDNIDTIVQRIFSDFYKMFDTKGFDLSYETKKHE